MSILQKVGCSSVIDLLPKDPRGDSTQFAAETLRPLANAKSASKAFESSVEYERDLTNDDLSTRWHDYILPSSSGRSL
jgi:hypothetical protein